MLNKLIIKNFALIEKSEIEFYNGLNILSGETGSGKSIIIEALNYVLGAKADKELIKNGETECSVVAEFDIEKNYNIKDILQSFDFDRDDTIIIARKMTIDGKNSIKLNGNTLTLSMLKKITSHLVDVHGQSEHFYLLDSENQLEFIDNFGEDIIKNIKANLSKEVDTYNQLFKELNSLGGDERQRLSKIDILSFQIDEIEKANITIDEEEQLLEKKKQLLNKEKIVNALNNTKNAVECEGGISDILSNVDKMLSNIADISDEYRELYERTLSQITELEDIASTASQILYNIEDDGVSLDEIEERLQTIKNIKRKYGATFEEINEFLINAKSEKDKLEKFDELYGSLSIKIEKQKNTIFEIYSQLHKAREDSSKKFSKNVLVELSELGFNNTDFYVQFDEINKEQILYTQKNGVDRIDFMFSANIGEPPKTLKNVISGGEISRFMLAIKAQSSKFSDIDTYIFDEIDSGISGKIAKVVAEKFYKISKNTQIIAITHLPQIAVMGDNNYLIYKVVDNGKTYSKIQLLDEENKNEEIVRLIGGETSSKNALSLAKELLIDAEKIKKII